jgi:hypothetical protein
MPWVAMGLHGDAMEMPWRCHGDAMETPWLMIDHNARLYDHANGNGKAIQQAW